MADTKEEIHSADERISVKDPELLSVSEESKPSRPEIHWYYSPAFLLIWVALFFAIVYPVFFYLPDGLQIKDVKENSCTFIAERSERILRDFENIGQKIVGTFANENLTVALLLNEIEKVRSSMNHELFQLDTDVQMVSGAYMHWSMVNMYQGVQNVVVRLTPRKSSSQSYLLINSHFDSKPGSPGSGDDGAMVVVMLEILRVLASTECPSFQHPIVFLFNGAEENPLQASHGFITQHKWAKNCKTLINLDSAGSGHREILFQSGPNHPWLMDYYRKHVRRPFATTMAEELFQSGAIPSDTDFRIFRDYGNVPGLDLAHSYNGYVYHTKFDRMNVIPRGTLQITGEHILSLAIAFANAPELEDPSQHANGHIVFFDFIGLFFMYYSETVAKIVNVIISVAAILVPGFSMSTFSSRTKLPMKSILIEFSLILALHLIGFILAFGLPLLIAIFYDSDDRTMTWFTNRWLVIGEYICPSLFGLSMPTLVFMSLRQHALPQPLRIQLALHAHAFILAILCIILTFTGLRSSYLLMLSLFFYTCALIINLVSTLHRRNYLWMSVLIASQIMPFLYFSYLIHAFLCTLIPMMGRFGSTTNPDLYVAILCALGSVLSLGFLIPALGIFRRPKSVLISLMVVTFIFAMMSLTHLGFPYREKTNVGRLDILNVRRVFYSYDGSVERNESGFYLDFQDRRREDPLKDHVDFSNLRSVKDDCDRFMMCGMPLYNHRWYKSRYEAMWLPSSEPLPIPEVPTLQLARKTLDPSTTITRFEFALKGPSHMSIFLQPLEKAKLTDWSFLRDMIDKPSKYQPPYHVYFSYGKDNSTLNFYFDIKKEDGNFNVPVFELGISGHFLSPDYPRGNVAEKFTNSFPDFYYTMNWPSSYERYIF